MAALLLTVLLALGSSGPGQNDLRIGIARVEAADSNPRNPEFAITLENQSDTGFIVVLGYVLGNGRMYPDAITLLLTDESGRASKLQYRPPLRVGGRVDPYIVALSRHASHVLRVSLAQYLSPYTGEGRTTPPVDGELDPRLPPGSYRIQATIEGPLRNQDILVNGNPVMHLWTGAVSSNVLPLSLAEPSRGVGRSLVSPEDRSTLIKALADQAMLHRRHDVAVRRGEQPPPLDNPELLPQLATVVGELHDPASIPALAAALGSGFAAIRPLAAFGEQAVPAVLAVEASPESSPGVIGEALITLRFIVEEASARGGLSDGTLAELRRVARRRLESGEGLALTPLWWAIDLAWTLQDKDLRGLVEALATDPKMVVARGITDPGLIEQTQHRAAARLAGTPPLPRP
jgi:hypothetical protein